MAKTSLKNALGIFPKDKISRENASYSSLEGFFIYCARHGFVYCVGA
jgi:hypothetical protein